MIVTRREWLKRSALLAAMVNTGFLSSYAKSKRIGIGACDWSIGKNSDPGSFEVAKKIGLDGVQLNLGSEANNMHLRDAAVQKLFKDASKQYGIKVASLAIGELNKVPYKSEEKTDQWVWDSVDVAKAFDVEVILLAFFNKNDLRNDDRGKSEVVRKLKL
jgi:sugar phosphate isomerase/epimerase